MVLATSAQLLAADQQRSRESATQTASVRSDVAPPALGGPVSSEPRSWLEMQKLLQDGRGITGGPALYRPAFKSQGTQMRLIGGGGKDLHPREPLPCGIYDDAAQFEAEQGPFSRALGNFEDMELTNAPPPNLCIIDSPENMDCTSSGPDPSGIWCSAPVVDAGDILTGVRVDSEPQRGAGWWEGLVTGVGFSGYPTKGFLPNYFGDLTTIIFPNSGAPTGCEKLSPGPNVVGMDLWHNNTSPEAEITLTLFDGSTVVQAVEDISSTPKFVGLCCSQEITKISIADTGQAQTIGVDNIKYGQAASPCPESFPPLTLEDIHDSLEVLEVKLDNIECTGGTGEGDCVICGKVVDAIEAKNQGVAQSLRAKLRAACKAFNRGQLHTAENILCAAMHHIDAQDGQGLDPADAQDLRDCITDYAADNDLDLDC
jgi:hypothetical protein